jgi:hypothetical protein
MKYNDAYYPKPKNYNGHYYPHGQPVEKNTTRLTVNINDIHQLQKNLINQNKDPSKKRASGLVKQAVKEFNEIKQNQKDHRVNTEAAEQKRILDRIKTLDEEIPVLESKLSHGYGFNWRGKFIGSPNAKEEVRKELNDLRREHQVHINNLPQVPKSVHIDNVHQFGNEVVKKEYIADILKHYDKTYFKDGKLRDRAQEIIRDAGPNRNIKKTYVNPHAELKSDYEPWNTPRSGFAEIPGQFTQGGKNHLLSLNNKFYVDVVGPKEKEIVTALARQNRYYSLPQWWPQAAKNLATTNFALGHTHSLKIAGNVGKIATVVGLVAGGAKLMQNLSGNSR